MSSRTIYTYGISGAGLTYSANTVSKGSANEVLQTIQSQGTIDASSIWYKFFPGFIDSGALTQVDGKFFFEGIMVSDIVSISVGVISGVVLLARLFSDLMVVMHKRKLAKIELEATKEK